jgi:glycosyltransferase involved in cell wall biosynthesis
MVSGQRSFELINMASIYINTPPWLISRHKTDWESKELMKELGRRFPEVEMQFPEGWLAGLGHNAAYLKKQLWHRLKLGSPFSRPRVADKLSPVWLRDLRRRKPDILLSHDQFPAHTNGIPVLWESQYLNPGDYLAVPSREDIESWDHWQGVFGELARRADIIGLRGSYSVSWRGNNSLTVPINFAIYCFFLPYLEPVNEEAVVEKHAAPGPVRILFAGRQARLKGLPLVLETAREIRKNSEIQLDIVSRYDDGPVQVPECDWIVRHGEISPPAIAQAV